MCGNVRCVAADVEQIRERIHEILSSSSERQKAEDARFWGDGHAAERIVSYLEHKG
jgi:UDP-N-acetylglucosamine 2-epimerase